MATDRKVYVAAASFRYRWIHDALQRNISEIALLADRLMIPIERKCGLLPRPSGRNSCRPRVGGGFGKTPRRLENSRTLLSLSLSLPLVPSDRAESGAVSLPCIVRAFHEIHSTKTRTEGKRTMEERALETRDTNERGRREESLDQPQALPSVTSRRRGTALRERLREARARRATHPGRGRAARGWLALRRERVSRSQCEGEREERTYGR